jgi:RecA-family ATPase
MDWTSTAEIDEQIVRLDTASDQQSLGVGEWDAGEDDELIGPRKWLLGNALCRKFTSSLIAEGGTGTTALRVAQALALATGRQITREHVFQRCRVLILSFEDDRDELRRRVRAACLHHKISRGRVILRYPPTPATDWNDALRAPLEAAA